METISERAGFLCNFEILTILKEQRDSRLAQTKLLEQKKRGNHLDENEEKMRIRPENLNTVTFECIKYLEESIHPLRRQTSTSITTALNDLEKLDLTKSERLQIINLAPTNLCELTVCIEEYEERFPHEHQSESILAIVKKSSSAMIITAASGAAPKLEVIDHSGIIGMEEEEDHPIGEEDEDEFVNEGLAGEGEANVRELDEGE